MRLIESLQLKKISAALNKFFLTHPRLSDAFYSIDEVGDISLQNLSYDEDEKFFADVSTIEGVIASIVSRPHLSTRREEIVARVEQAKQLSPDDFTRVCRESSLWKRRKSRMIPENIYYYQHIDELAIYENKFIVYLVDIIDRELSKYQRFYAEELPSINGNEIELCGGRAFDALALVDRLRHRINHIKETHFYKVISAEKKIEGKIKPTNILIKDEKYRACYKFYNKFVRYREDGEREDLSIWFRLLVLKALKTLDFHAIDSKNGTLFEKDDLILTFADGSDIILDITDRAGGTKVRHVLLTNDDSGVRQRFEDSVTVERADIWNVYDETDKRIFPSGLSESDLVLWWLKTKIRVIKANFRTYKKYCPVCKSTSLVGDRIVTCDHCKSAFVYTQREGEDSIWLCRLRRNK